MVIEKLGLEPHLMDNLPVPRDPDTSDKSILHVLRDLMIGELIS